ncbi:hypothetical protein [Novosphingobium profundi]|uniref:hypothetical protein n=1 Tax=Novosphingobium profundi TaxID=1774954 RepID=UPI001CFE629B|nr:hypothetical protein [Novosphingobium profundi]
MSEQESAAGPAPLSPAQIEESLLASLSPLARLALSYAPHRTRLQTLALFALDARLANLLRHSSEPMLAQLRLSWWRETLGQDASAWPQGEPLLAAFRSWTGGHHGAVALVDGWEALTAPAPLTHGALQSMADGRARAFGAFAQEVGCAGAAGQAEAIGRAWGLSDLAVRLSKEEERAAVERLLANNGATTRGRVPRALRPLKVLEVLSARRHAKGSEEAARSPGALMRAIGVGLLGR